jgi:hypothetical protein
MPLDSNDDDEMMELGVGDDGDSYSDGGEQLTYCTADQTITVVAPTSAWQDTTNHH